MQNHEWSKDYDKIMSLVKEQSHRINTLEKQLDILKGGAPAEYKPEPKHNRKPVKLEHKIEEKHEYSGPTFTQFITTAGIIGIVISLISFFTYAISNNWIGPLGQILIGVFVGLVLFFAGFMVYDRHRKWSLTCFGGAIFIEYLSVGFGALYYGIINVYFAFALLLIFMLIGVALSTKYDSLLLAYFAIIGGFLTPLISGTYNNYVFTASFLLLLSAGILIISFSKNWASLRLVSFLMLLIYEWAMFRPFADYYSSGLSAELSILFLALYFIAYHVASIMYSLNSDNKMAAIDIIVLNANTFFSAILMTYIFFAGSEVISQRGFGAIGLIYSFLFLIEAYIFKLRFSSKLPTIYSVLTSGIIVINISLALIFNLHQDILRLIVLTLPQWLLFAYLANKTKDSKFYNIFSYIFLACVLLWWLRFMWQLSYLSTGDATFIIVMMLAFIICLVTTVVNDINKKVHGFLLVIMGFLFIFSLVDYISALANISYKVETMVLSEVWLIYTLVLYVKARRTGMVTLRRLSLILLIITLVKIGLFDITRLSGIVRIVAFFVFGILLIAGGYLIKK